MNARTHWRRVAAIVVSLGLVLVLASAALAGTRGRSYEPPFKKGAQGGDQANFIYSDPSSGQVAVFRMYPVFNPFTCGSSRGGWVTLRQPIRVTRPIASVEVDYQAAVDPYSFVTVTVRDDGTYLGSKDVRGPIFGSGNVNVPLSFGKARKGSTIDVDFGVQVPSACPNLEEAAAQFSRVVVHDA
jgi:hypothetical protein